jgi:hypothetical protein
MTPDSFLHERSDFKALVETVADSEKINDPALVEKDYWIMHAVQRRASDKALGFLFLCQVVFRYQVCPLF